MNHTQQKHTVDTLFVLSLFLLFALSSVFLIVIGANIYRKTIQHMDTNFNTRTAVAYITEKVHQSDKAGQLSVSTLEGHSAIVFSSFSDDIEYETYLYEDHGYLKELMMRKDLPLSASAGQEIVQVEYFTVSHINDSLLLCTIRLNGEEEQQFYIASHTGGLSDEY